MWMCVYYKHSNNCDFSFRLYDYYHHYSISLSSRHSDLLKDVQH